MSKKTIQKNLRFPSNIVEVLESEGGKLGFSFTDYIKYLAVKKVEEIMKREREEVLYDAALIADIIDARRDIKSGKLTYLKTDKEIEEHFASLLAKDE